MLGKGSAISILEIANRLPFHYFLPNCKGKDGAFPIDAFHVKLAVHERQKLDGDVHPKSCAFDGTVAFFFDALKGLEQFFLVFRLDPDPRVADGELQQNGILSCLLKVNAHGHAAFFRILHGIGEDVCRHLLDADFISVKIARQTFIGFDFKLQPLLFRASANHVHQIVQHRSQLILHGNDIHFPRFNLGEVQNVIHQSQQICACRADILRIFQQRRILALTQNHLVHAQNGIDWRAYLMGHVGKEL